MSVMHTNTLIYIYTVENIVYLFLTCKTLMEKKKITVYLLIQLNSRTLYSSQGQFKRSMKVALKGSTYNTAVEHTSKVLGVVRQ